MMNINQKSQKLDKLRDDTTIDLTNLRRQWQNRNKSILKRRKKTQSRKNGSVGNIRQQINLKKN